jgi:4-amino-4-deoxy-L-arabinose transferase-like glycosyltransferase
MRESAAGVPRRRALWVVSLAILAAVHGAFAWRNERPLSHDEYVYLEGAAALVESYEQGGLAAAASSWRQILGVHPPLMSTLGALAMPFFDRGEAAGLAVSGLLLLLLALAFRRFARDLLGHPEPELAALLLVTLPLLTALTHAFYIELLMLLLGLEVVYLLATGALRSSLRSMGAGALLGLALLAKASSAPFLLPLVGLHGLHEWRTAAAPRPRLVVVGRGALLLVTTLAVVWPWYSLNAAATWRHMRQSAFCCPFPMGRYLLAVATDGSSLLVTVIALAGCRELHRRWRAMSTSQRRAWLDLALLAGSSFLAMATSQDRAVRFMNFALPVLAALAGLFAAGAKRRGATVLALAGFTLLLALHQTVRLPRLPEIRLGQLTVFSHRSALNLPHWAIDGLPADPRPHPHAEVLRWIAEATSGRGERQRVGITTLSHLVSQNYFRFHSRARAPQLEFLNLQWMPETELRRVDARFDFLVRFVDWEHLYPGALHSDLWDRVAGDSPSDLRFRLAHVVAGPQGTKVEIYRRSEGGGGRQAWPSPRARPRRWSAAAP